MKRVQLLLILIGCFILMILIGCSTVKNVEADPETLVRIVTQGNYIQYEEENELFDAADLIVIAKANKSFKDRAHVVVLTSDANTPPMIADFFTRTEITIAGVLKQPDSSSLSKNDKIKIIEPISLMKNESDIKIITVENYVEIEEGKYYIIYLKNNTYGEYGVINMNNGRFNIEGDDNIIIHEHENDIEKHEIMKRNVMARFEKEIRQLVNK